MPRPSRPERRTLRIGPSLVRPINRVGPLSNIHVASRSYRPHYSCAVAGAFAWLQGLALGAWISFPGQNESTASPDLSRIVTQVEANGRAGGATPGVLVSGHLRFCFGASVVLAGFSTAPASSNPFADFFEVAPQTATAAASAESECLPRPGKSMADGQHWVYRLDGHRKCWFLAAEGITTVKKPVHRHVAKHRIAAPAENETAWHKRETLVDAHAELLRSAPPMSEAMPPAFELKVADAASVAAIGAAAVVPSAPVPNRATDQFTPDRSAPGQVDVEALLAAAPAASDAVAVSMAPASHFAVPIVEAGDDGPGWTANWVGLALMVLGLVSVLSSSRTVREAILLRD